MIQDIYNDQTAISKTGLDYIEISPLDYWWRYLNPEREPYVKSKDVIFDEALRMAITDTVRFSFTYVKQPAINKRTNFGKAEYSQLQESIEKNGQVLLSAEDFDTIMAMRDAVGKHPTAKIILSDGQVGEPKRFIEQNSGAIIGFCPHWIHKGKMVVNISSTKGSAGRENFSKECLNFKLHKKAALQLDGTGCSLFVFLVIEKEAPYKMQIHELDYRSLDLGRAQYVKNCRTYLECLKTGKWPGLPEKIEPASLPEWAFKNY